MSSKNCLIIAEAGVNHNGSMVMARELIEAAAFAGVNYIKFQTFKSDLIIAKSAKKAEYQIVNSENKNETQLDMIRKYELSYDQFIELKAYCIKKNIGFLSTGFDIPSIDFLNKLEIPFFKIPSGEITNKPYLKHVASKGKPVIMSTGMSDLEEIESAFNILLNEGLLREQITLLHCNSEYPTPMIDVNLKAMLTIQSTFKVNVGYSDHTLGIEIPIAAVALGASVIEKHFTLDRNLEGPDHKASLEPGELKAMVNSIRNVELALSGNAQKIPSPSEISNKSVVRKSIHLARDLKNGTPIKMEHLIMKRPGDGISPMQIDDVIGRKLNADLKSDHQLEWKDLS